MEKNFSKSPNSEEHCFASWQVGIQSPPPSEGAFTSPLQFPRTAAVPAQFSPAVFISMVQSVGTTLRGTAGLGERAGELGSQELRSSKENFSCKSNVAVDSNRGDWVSGHLGSTGLSQQHGGQGSTILSDPSPDGLEHT